MKIFTQGGVKKKFLYIYTPLRFLLVSFFQLLPKVERQRVEYRLSTLYGLKSKSGMCQDPFIKKGAKARRGNKNGNCSFIRSLALRFFFLIASDWERVRGNSSTCWTAERQNRGSAPSIHSAYLGYTVFHTIVPRARVTFPISFFYLFILSFPFFSSVHTLFLSLSVSPSHIKRVSFTEYITSSTKV